MAASNVLSRNLYAVTALVALVSLWGCGPKVQLLRQGATLDYPALSRGGISICGVTPTPGKGQGFLGAGRERLTAMLERAFLSARKDLRVVRNASFRSKLGEALYATTVDGFARTGELNPSSMATLDSLVGDQGRFLTLARIEDVDATYSELETQDKPGDILGDTKKYKTTKVKVRVAFHLYDLQSRESVWSASITSSKGATNTHTDRWGQETFSEWLGSALQDKDEYPPGDVERVLYSAFSRFAKKLPGPG